MVCCRFERVTVSIVLLRRFGSEMRLQSLRKQAILASSAAYRRMALDAGHFKDAMSDLGGFTPDRRTERSQVESAYGIALQKAKTEVDVARTEGLRSNALDETTRKEDVIRQGRELDLHAVNACTVAEQALIASERERLALPGKNLDQSERAPCIAAQSSMIVAQANRAAEDTLQQVSERRGGT
jgi:hypothetical protein